MTSDARAPLPWKILSVLILAELALYLLSSGPLAYGYMNDELYYFDCADRLAWGYVDHPPLSLVLLHGVRATLGDSLLAIHLLPALAACATLVLVALLARELGGGRTAQGLAALAALIAPVYLAIAGFYSMNAFEPVLWAGAALILARIRNGDDPRLWLALGLVLGLGLLNKISMLWFGLGLAVGLVLTPERRWLATPWPYLRRPRLCPLRAAHRLAAPARLSNARVHAQRGRAEDGVEVAARLRGGAAPHDEPAGRAVLAGGPGALLHLRRQSSSPARVDLDQRLRAARGERFGTSQLPGSRLHRAAAGGWRRVRAPGSPPELALAARHRSQRARRERRRPGADGDAAPLAGILHRLRANPRTLAAGGAAGRRRAASPALRRSASDGRI